MSNAFDDIAWLDGCAQAELVRRGTISPVELVETAIRRIEYLNPRLNAVVTPMYEDARRIARSHRADRPFAGVPMLLKDSLAGYAGVATTSGSRLLKGRIAERDSDQVRRFKQAGLIVLGKANCAEFGLLPTTEPALFGPTRNPWDLTRTPGGSSGGSAVAVASGMVAIAHGTDGGGSIRIPASCCGIFGLKPSRGRIPMQQQVSPAHAWLVVEHVLTRSVRDSAKMLDLALTGDAKERLPVPGDFYFEQAGIDPGPLRIAFGAPAGLPMHPDCRYALADAVVLCQSLGHDLVEAAPALDHVAVAQAFGTLWEAGCAAIIQSITLERGQPVRAEELESLTWEIYQRGLRVSPRGYQRAEAALQAISADVARFFESFDVWLTPVTPDPPFPLGSLNAATSSAAGVMLERAVRFAAFSVIPNITGLPAMSVPLHWNREGWPIGSQFIGRFGDEATLFRLASQLERARPWAHRRPPVVSGRTTCLPGDPRAIGEALCASRSASVLSSAASLTFR